MDPLSALSIAAAGVQFVDFARRLLSDTVETYKSTTGQPDRVDLLKHTTNELASLTSNIEKKRSKLQGAAPAGSPDAIFVEACRQCSEVSQDLTAVFQKLDVKEWPKGKVRSAGASLTVAIRGLLSESKISALTDKLEAIQRQMQMAALVSLWEKAHEHGETLSQISQQQADTVATLERVDATTRDLAIDLSNLADGRSTRLDPDARGLVRAMWTTKWSPSPRANRANHDSVTDPGFADMARLHIFNSLVLKSAQDREAAIPKAYTQTFEWLFERHSDLGHDQASSWSDFPAWLEAASREIYWITGKPGSGKSTLMKFLAAHPRLREHLSVWAGSRQVLVASFYFWNAGTKLQKSHEGLLRTFLLQSLQQRPDLTPRVCERRWACLDLEMLGATRASVLPPWEWDELLHSFKSLASQAGPEDYRLVLLIDGLDEFDGDHTKLVDLIRELSDSDWVKICVSSRPWNVFNDSFARSPSLVVQNLTRKDIDSYVKGHFVPLPAFQELEAIHQDEAANLLDDIASRAQGVFLWVAIVVRALVVLLSEGERLAGLRATLNALPQDIENLFEAIRRQINVKHRADLARYILLLWANATTPSDARLHAVTMLLADEDEESSFHQRLDDAKKTKMIAVMRRRLHSRTMGLLELYPSGEVGFLHRTVFEWVSREDILASIQSDTPIDFNPNLELLKARTTEFTSLKLTWEYMAMTCPDVEVPERDGPFAHASIFWFLFALCLQLASLAHTKVAAGNNARIIRLVEKLNNHADQVARREHYNDSEAFRILNGSGLLPRELSDHNDLKQYTFIRLAARSAVLPFVAAKTDRTVLSKHPALFPLLLIDAVFGLTHFKGLQKYRGIPRLFHQNVVPLSMGSRLELVAHLLRVAPRTWKNHDIIRKVERETRRWLAGTISPKKDRDFMHKALELLQKKLGITLWFWKLRWLRGTEGLVWGEVSFYEVTRRYG